MGLSRSTIILFLFLMLMALGAIIVAREFRSRLSTPAGIRLSSQGRLRVLAEAMRAYRQAHQVYPETRLQLIRDRHLGMAAFAGIGYRRPAADAAETTIVVWREEILPGALAGEPWAGPHQPTDKDIPPAGQTCTLAGEVTLLPVPEFEALIRSLEPGIERTP